MLRKRVALPLLIAPLLGCRSETDAPPAQAVAEQPVPTEFPVAPFCEDIHLPEASQARAWTQPAQGPPRRIPAF